MLFNGANIAERIDVSANGGRVRFTRDVANIVMDSNDVEKIDLNALGGADVLTVNDLSGTDLTRINSNLAASGGGDDAAADNVVVNATSGDRCGRAERRDQRARVDGLSARVVVTGAFAGTDRVTVNAQAATTSSTPQRFPPIRRSSH